MTPTPATPRTDARKLGLLFVLCGAIFLEGIDVAMLNVALPSIRDDLGLSTAMLSGVVSAYVLGYGGFMLLGGRAADVLGRRAASSPRWRTRRAPRTPGTPSAR